MVARLFPADAVSGAPSYTGRALRQSQSPFLAGATTARPLGSISGVRPGTPASTVTVTSTTWSVAPFAGVIDLQAAAIAGPYTFAFDASVTGAVTAAGGTARIDALAVRVNDGAEGDGTVVAPFAEIVYTAGTSAAPAVPARSFVIAYINVPATGGGAPTVTWIAPYCAAAGGVVDFNTLTQLQAWTTAKLWTEAVVIATGSKYVWNGSVWASASASVGAVVVASGFSLNASTSLVKSRDGIVTLNLFVGRNSGTIALNEQMCTLPPAFCPTVPDSVMGGGFGFNGVNAAAMRVYQGGSVIYVGPVGNITFIGTVTFAGTV